MKTPVAAICALLAVGCSDVSVITPTAAKITTSAFATLASAGTYEVYTAPSYTRIKLTAHNATVRLQKGTISLATAKGVLAAVESAEAELAASTWADRRGDGSAALDHLNRANELLDRATLMLEPRP